MALCQQGTLGLGRGTLGLGRGTLGLGKIYSARCLYMVTVDSTERLPQRGWSALGSPKPSSRRGANQNNLIDLQTVPVVESLASTGSLDTCHIKS